MHRRSDRAFTLVELMVVVAIIAILLAVAIPAYLGARSRGQESVARTSAQIAMKTAISVADSSLATLTVAALAAAEPSLTFQTGASTGPKVVSASVGLVTTFGIGAAYGARFAVLSADGTTCVGTAVLDGGTVRYGRWSTAVAPCDGVTAGGAASGASFSGGPATGTVTVGANGHGYELVTGPTTWAGALAGAQQRTWTGLTGHLVTVSASTENSAVAALLPFGMVAWLAGTDSASEGAWRWVAGPDDGTQFWSGAASGSGGAAVGGNYTNWGGGEPNGGTGENCLQVYSSPVWNDLPCSSAVGAYVVEYE